MVRGMVSPERIERFNSAQKEVSISLGMRGYELQMGFPKRILAVVCCFDQLVSPARVPLHEQETALGLAQGARSKRPTVHGGIYLAELVKCDPRSLEITVEGGDTNDAAQRAHLINFAKILRTHRRYRGHVPTERLFAVVAQLSHESRGERHRFTARRRKIEPHDVVKSPLGGFKIAKHRIELSLNAKYPAPKGRVVAPRRGVRRERQSQGFSHMPAIDSHTREI